MTAVLEKVVRAIGMIGFWVLIPAQIVVAVYFLIGRQFTVLPATLLQELEWYLFLVMAFLSFGIALLGDRHVRIDVFRDRWSPRTRAWIEVIGFFVALLPCFLLLTWLGASAAWDSFQANESSRSPTGMPWRWIVRGAVPAGAALVLMAGIVVTARNIALLRARPNQAMPTEHPTIQREPLP